MGDERRINQLTTKAYSDIGSSDYFAVDNASEAESKKLPVSAIKDGINDASTAASSAASTASTASTNATRALNIARSTSSFPTGDAYSSSSAYKVGDLVIYNNTLYRCKTACSAASWSTNASNFESISLASAITDLNNDLGFGYAENTNAVNNYKYPLQIRFIKQKTLNHNTYTLTQFTQFPHDVLCCIAFPQHNGFAATSTVSFNELSNGSVRLFQYNSSGVAMFVSAIIIGY